MPIVCYVSELDKSVPLDAEHLLRFLGVSGKLSGCVYVGTGAGEAGVYYPDYRILYGGRSCL